MLTLLIEIDKILKPLVRVLVKKIELQTTSTASIFINYTRTSTVPTDFYA